MSDWYDELRTCPICKNKVPYGDMIWLDGLCTCEACYKHRSAKYDKSDSNETGGTIMEDKFTERTTDVYISRTEMIVLLYKTRKRYIGDATDEEIENDDELSLASNIIDGLIEKVSTVMKGQVKPIEEMGGRHSYPWCKI